MQTGFVYYEPKQNKLYEVEIKTIKAKRGNTIFIYLILENSSNVDDSDLLKDKIEMMGNRIRLNETQYLSDIVIPLFQDEYDNFLNKNASLLV